MTTFRMKTFLALKKSAAIKRVIAVTCGMGFLGFILGQNTKSSGSFPFQSVQQISPTVQYVHTGVNCDVPYSKLYVVTPSSRLNYLKEIRKTFPKDYDWVWIIVHSFKPPQDFFPGERNIYEVWPGFRGNLTDEPVTWGNIERNFGIFLVKAMDSYVYFLDDDNGMHPGFWRYIYPFLLENKNDFITCNQQCEPNSLRRGPQAVLNGIDTGMFITQRGLIGDSRWHLSKQNADGLFAVQMQAKAVAHIFVNETCSFHNSMSQNFSPPT